MNPISSEWRVDPLLDVVYTGNSNVAVDGEVCLICREEEMLDGAMTCCKTRVHKACMTDYFEYTNKCAACRKEFNGVGHATASNQSTDDEAATGGDIFIDTTISLGQVPTGVENVLAWMAPAPEYTILDRSIWLIAAAAFCGYIYY